MSKCNPVKSPWSWAYQAQGKSTLIRHLNRLIEPTDGEILVDGVDVMNLSTTDLRQDAPRQNVDGVPKIRASPASDGVAERRHGP